MGKYLAPLSVSGTLQLSSTSLNSELRQSSSRFHKAAGLLQALLLSADMPWGKCYSGRDQKHFCYIPYPQKNLDVCGKLSVQLKLKFHKVLKRKDVLKKQAWHETRIKEKH